MKLLKIFVFSAIFVVLVYLFLYPWFIPIDHLKRENPKLTAMMKFRIKQWEREGKNIRVRQVWVPLSKISPFLIKAVLIAEDDKFYKHSGFDLEAIQKAIEKNLQAGKIKYGGSTISQQTAKNLFLNPSRNPVRKIHEAILTYRIENSLSKKRILEIYLNIAEWGEGIFGIEMASRHYFGKHASQLSPWEAARLAAVLPNPIKYSPLSQSSFVERRSRLIYFIMKKRGIIKEDYLEFENREEPDGSDKIDEKPINNETSEMPSKDSKADSLGVN
ncbi:MAG: monofunctional biosynthetic peptidoglycan transglycosylase [Candidatus Kryptonium sp.]